ncbi:MAG: hypothetical protein NT002_13080 [candidate division Zixibacteria bacterium]|nr:hypothetical protein [candidate division Zixibacteria bacterium]
MAEADRQHDGADTRQISQGLNSSAGKNKGDRKRLMENFLSLSLLQGARHIPPLINVPYAVRVLNPGKFGTATITQFFVPQINLFLSMILLSETLIFIIQEYNPMPLGAEWQKALNHGKL